MGKTLDEVAPIALGVIGSIVAPELAPAWFSAIGGGALGAGLGSAGVNYSQTHNFGDAAKAGALSGAGSYVGANVAGSVLGNQLGTVGSDLGVGQISNSSGLPDVWNAATANSMDDTAGFANTPWLQNTGSSTGIGGAFNSAMGTQASQIAGGYAGNSLASQYAPQGPGSMAGQYPWIPAEPGQPGGGASVSMPSSLNSMSSLTPQQQASGLATQGAYGGGLGPQEQGYFSNLVQNQLVPQHGQTAPLSTLSPVENTYLSNLGFGNEGSSYNLAKALSQWNPSS